MSLVHWKVALLAVLFAAAPLTVQAAEPPQDDAKKVEKKKYSAEELEAFGKQLDSDNQAQRDEASRKLLEVGKQAVEVLGKVAGGKSNEASSRAFDVLKKLYAQKDVPTQKAVKEALEKLAKSDNPRLARRAADVLKSAEKEVEDEAEEQEGVFQFQGGNFQFRVVPVPGGGAQLLPVQPN